MNKIRIAMFDTNAEELKFYAKTVKSICENNNTVPEIKTYDTYKSLLFDMGDPEFTSMTSILVIDPDQGNAAVLSAVRELGFTGHILCLSHSMTPDCLFHAFDAKVFNYTQKGAENMFRFQTVFEQALESLEQIDRQYIVVSHKGEYRQIDIRDIEYCETMANHMVSICYKDGTFEFLSSMSELEDRLGKHGFVRVHRSYLVAAKCIQHLSYNMLTLTNGQELPIGRKYYTHVKAEKNHYMAQMI